MRLTLCQGKYAIFCMWMITRGLKCAWTAFLSICDIACVPFRPWISFKKRVIAEIFSKISLTKKLAGMLWMVWCESQQTGGVGRRVHLLWLPGWCNSKTTTFLWDCFLKSRKEECGTNVPPGDVLIVNNDDKFERASQRQCSLKVGLFCVEVRWRVERGGNGTRDNVNDSVFSVCNSKPR